MVSASALLAADMKPMVGYEMLATPQRDITAETAARWCAMCRPNITWISSRPRHRLTPIACGS